MPNLEPVPTAAGLLVIVPSRGRPESVARVAQAWHETGAYDDAHLVFAIDEDDPRYAEYYGQPLPAGAPQLTFVALSEWQPMVGKLNECAVAAAASNPPWAGIAFMGDDHLPRTAGWTGKVLTALTELRTGIVYSADGIQNERLPTWWAMTPDIISTLGKMVPAPVEHLYSDNAIKELGVRAGCLHYLPDVLIEHMHPFARKADWDAGHLRVNSPEQYVKDGAAYKRWLTTQLPMDAAIVRTLREQPEA